MSARRQPCSNTQIQRVIDLARENGIDIGGLEVGPDYVRITPAQGESEIAQFVNRSAHSPQKAQVR